MPEHVQTAPQDALPLHTQRLALRDFAAEDWFAVHGYAADPEVARYMDWGPNSDAETRAFIERVLVIRQAAPRRDFELAITLRADGRLIGGCGIHVSNPRNREGWIGYILRRDCWGQGYASEAARALLGFGFGALGLHRIYATCDLRNLASARVLEKIGMRHEGHMREHRWQKSAWRDSLLYAILEHELT
ncbi:MAG: GNAT family N-acetyltransferase [Roseiflexaceae bacterium]